MTKAATFTDISEAKVFFPDNMLAKKVKIAHGAVIGKSVIIGEGTIIGAYATIADWTTIGKNCVIHSHTSIGSKPQNQESNDEKSYVIIGDNTQIREFVTVNSAIGSEQATRIGSHCLLSAGSHIAHNCTIGNHVIISNAVHLADHAEVEDWVTIGGLTIIQRFVKIGRNAMIGATSKVVQDIPPFILANGNPAQAFGLNNIGMNRMGINDNNRRILKHAYKIMYYSGDSLSQTLAIMKQQLPVCEELEHLMVFLRNNKKGICNKHKSKIRSKGIRNNLYYSID
ncbi:MAG TPA: acyl-ACP--UDP-N-acetylglucosamine O-acyltransferase [Negativicutes bacterium]|jgi:UDP-N-acetylglucosamine acyltransferase